MAKKSAKPRKKRAPVRHVISLSEDDAKTEKILIENFVALQRVMTHLSERFDNLAMQTSKLLNLFEISAKALAEKEFNTEGGGKDFKKVAEKLDGLVEQNKTIAKGLFFLHQQVAPPREMESPIQEEPPMSQPPMNALPVNQIPRPQMTPRMSPHEMYPPSPERYQKSISSEGSGSAQTGPKFKPLPK